MCFGLAVGVPPLEEAVLLLAVLEGALELVLVTFLLAEPMGLPIEELALIPDALLLDSAHTFGGVGEQKPCKVIPIGFEYPGPVVGLPVLELGLDEGAVGEQEPAGSPHPVVLHLGGCTLMRPWYTLLFLSK